jgi:hypothetical protein
MPAENLNRTLAPPVLVASNRIKRSLLSLRFPPFEKEEETFPPGYHIRDLLLTPASNYASRFL